MLAVKRTSMIPAAPADVAGAPSKQNSLRSSRASLSECLTDICRPPSTATQAKEKQTPAATPMEPLAPKAAPSAPPPAVAAPTPIPPARGPGVQPKPAAVAASQQDSAGKADPLGPLRPASHDSASAAAAAFGVRKPSGDSGSLPIASSRVQGGRAKAAPSILLRPASAEAGVMSSPDAGMLKPLGRPVTGVSSAPSSSGASPVKPAVKKQSDGQLKRNAVDFNPLL